MQIKDNIITTIIDRKKLSNDEIVLMIRPTKVHKRLFNSVMALESEKRMFFWQYEPISRNSSEWKKLLTSKMIHMQDKVTRVKKKFPLAVVLHLLIKLQKRTNIVFVSLVLVSFFFLNFRCRKY